MIRGLWTGASGMEAQQLILDTVANNLANANTTGFKRSRANFQDLLYQTYKLAGATTEAGGQVPTGIQVGMGTKASSIQKIFMQGDLVQTGNDLDIAIEGQIGFFKVTGATDSQDYYTRAGNFTLDSNGIITTPEGDVLQPSITIPAGTTKITVQSDGKVTANTPTGIQDLGQVLLYSFRNPAGLFAMGRNLLKETTASGTAEQGTPGSEGFATLTNNYLENSNVNIVEEMVSMITSQRAYESNSKTVQTADTMLQTANNLKR